jgi:Flp pilus assembly protein TadD
MSRRRVTSRRLARWLQGTCDLADLFRLSKDDLDELAWQAHRLLELGTVDQAERIFELLRTIRPTNAYALTGLGACKQMRGDLLGAERAYSEVLDQDPTNVYALANRAEVRLLCGGRELARTDLAAALDRIARTKCSNEIRLRVDRLSELAEAEGAFVPEQSEQIQRS